MELTLSRLKGGKRRKRVEMVDEASVDDALEDFGNKVEIRNGAVAGEVVNRKGVSFVEGSDDGMLKGKRKVEFGNGEIDKSSNRKDENIETRFKKSCGNEIERACSIGRRHDSRSNLRGSSRKKG